MPTEEQQPPIPKELKAFSDYYLYLQDTEAMNTLLKSYTHQQQNELFTSCTECQHRAEVSYMADKLISGLKALGAIDLKHADYTSRLSVLTELLEAPKNDKELTEFFNDCLPRVKEALLIQAKTFTHGQQEHLKNFLHPPSMFQRVTGMFSPRQNPKNPTV